MARKTTLVLTAFALLVLGTAVRLKATTATHQPVAAELERLQGTWEGVLVGHESAGKITLSFTGNTLHFQGLKTDEWYDATFTLQEGARPQQLHATITGCENQTDIGKVIGAIFQIVDGTLSLAGLEDGTGSGREEAAPEPVFKIDLGGPNVCGPTLDDSEAFNGNSLFHYRFRKVEPPAKKTAAPKVP